MKALPIIPISKPPKPTITLQEALNQFNEASRIQSLFTMSVTRQAINLAIEAFTFIQESRITTPGSVPTLLDGEADA